jgi:CheY-like chemotaxis protein/anti-sigma regulatory factor (Ser/Thr protein kinase)
MDVESVEFQLQPLIDECLRTIEPMIQGDVCLIRQIAPDLPMLVSDQDKIRQVLINLLSNAAKFTERGTITVQARHRNQAVEIATTDTGIGIREEAQARVFEDFGQADSTSTRRHGGTGLGLAISKRLANLLGGDLSLRSTVGVGSTFTLTIPVRQEQRPTDAPAPAPASAAEDGTAAVRVDRDRLVLAIDDDPDTIVLLQENLTDAGYRVVGVTDPGEGLEKARALRPRVIILDIIMPDTDGWHVLHQLKTDPATRDIPVVVLTVVDQAKLGLGLGAADYIVKPFERDALVATLAQVTKPDGPLPGPCLISSIAS